MNQPTPYELVALAISLGGAAKLNSGSDHQADEALSNALRIWRRAHGVLSRGGGELETEEAAILAEAAASDARSEALAEAEKAPARVVSWSDAVLWAAVGEGPKGPKETAGQVSERIYKKFRARLIADGRGGEVRPKSDGVVFGFAVSFLTAERKPGPKAGIDPEEITPSGK